MGVGELLLGLVTALAAFVGSSAPVAAWTRTRETRFVLVAGAYLGLLALGVLAVYGESVADPPGFARIPTVPLVLIAAVAVLLASTGLVARRR